MDIQRFLHKKVMIPFVCMIFLLGYLGVGLSMGPLFLESGLSNENFIPVIIAVIGIALCISIMIDGMKEIAEEGTSSSKAVGLKQIILFADFFLFIGLYKLIGFIGAAFVFTFLFMLFFDDKITAVVKKLIISAIITGLIYILYAVIFGVRFN